MASPYVERRTATGEALFNDGAGLQSTISSASGASTASTLVGSAVVSSAITSAAGASTAGTLTGVTGTGSTIGTAAGSATGGSLAGASTAVASFDVAAGASSGATMTDTPAPEPSASTGAGRSKRRQQRPVVVEIDGEDFVVESEAEAVALLDKAKEQAEQLAEVQIARAAKAERRKTGKVIADARKTLVVPQIKAPGLESYAAQVLADIRDTYASTMRTIEVAALLRKRDREEEDDEDVLLLLL